MSLPYNQHLDLNFKTVNFEVEKSTGPLEVEFTAQPRMITDQKVVFSGENDMSGRTITVTRPDESAQFTITVKNKNTGQTLLEQGYGGVHDSSKTTQKYTIRDEGPYVIDLRGEKIEVDLIIRPQNYVAPATTIISKSAYSQSSPGVTRVTFVMVTPTNAVAGTPYTTASPKSSSSSSTNSILSSTFFLLAPVLVLGILMGGVYVLYTKSQTPPQGPIYIPPMASPPVSLPSPDDLEQKMPLPEPLLQPPLAPQPKSPTVSVMDNLPRQKLKEIVGKFGPGIITNPKKVKGLLLDYCASSKSTSGGNFQKEVHLLILAINQNIPQDLLNTSQNEPYEFKRTRLQKRLTDLAFEAPAAQWAVDAWAEALGFVSAGDDDS